MIEWNPEKVMEALEQVMKPQAPASAPDIKSVLSKMRGQPRPATQAPITQESPSPVTAPPTAQPTVRPSPKRGA